MHVRLIGTRPNLSQSAVVAFTSPSRLTSNQIPDSLGAVVSLAFNILASGSETDIFGDHFFLYCFFLYCSFFVNITRTS